MTTIDVMKETGRSNKQLGNRNEAGGTKRVTEEEGGD